MTGRPSGPAARAPRDERVAMRDLRRGCAVELSADAIFVVDAAGRVCDANQAAGLLCVQDLAALHGVSVRDLLDVDPLLLLSAPGTPGAHWAGEILVRRPAGPPLARRGTSVVFESADGELYRYITVRAIEPRDQPARSLRVQALDALGELAAGMAHELNTPTQYIGDNLGFLLGAYEQLAGLAIADADAASEIAYLREEIPLAVTQSREGIVLVSALVEAWKRLASPPAAESSLVDLNNEVESALTVSRYEWKYVASVARELDLHLPLVPCRGGALRQVVLRLVLDAARAVRAAPPSSEPGLIAVRTWCDPTSVLLSVRDTGIERTAIDRSLALEREVLGGADGGTIDVVSARGRGTTVTVRVPRAVAA